MKQRQEGPFILVKLSFFIFVKYLYQAINEKFLYMEFPSQQLGEI